jgi:hypothetical protein
VQVSYLLLILRKTRQGLSEKQSNSLKELASAFVDLQHHAYELEKGNDPYNLETVAWRVYGLYDTQPFDKSVNRKLEESARSVCQSLDLVRSRALALKDLL